MKPQVVAIEIKRTPMDRDVLARFADDGCTRQRRLPPHARIGIFQIRNRVLAYKVKDGVLPAKVEGTQRVKCEADQRWGRLA